MKGYVAPAALDESVRELLEDPEHAHEVLHWVLLAEEDEAEEGKPTKIGELTFVRLGGTLLVEPSGHEG